MRNSLVVILCWLLCMSGVSVAQRTSKKQSSIAAQVRQVQRTVEMFNQAWAANNAEGVRRICAEEVVMTKAGRRFRGLQPVLDYLQFNFKNFPEMEIQLGPVEARVIGSMAWAHADSRATLIASRGLKLNLAGYSSYVLERQRSGWKIVLMDFDLRPVQLLLLQERNPLPQRPHPGPSRPESIQTQRRRDEQAQTSKAIQI